MRLNTHKYTSSLVVMLLVIAFLTGGLWGGIIGAGLVMWTFGANDAQPMPIIVQAPTQVPPIDFEPTVAPLPSPTPTPVLLSSANSSIESAVETALVSVVTVVNYQTGYRQTPAASNRRIVGSGVIVDAQGYIVTNAHVVAESASIEVVLLDGETLAATLIIDNPGLDLALLKVEGDFLTAATWGETSQVRLGQPVIAIGSALGDFPNSVTMGIVSGLDRALALEGFVAHGLIQTDAAINQGNSGGPLINLGGEVIGINTFMIREDHNQGMAQGIGFAIPASSVKALVRNWMAQDTQPGSTILNIEEGGSQTTNSSGQ